MLCVKTFINKPVTSNCYVLFDKDFGNECIIVDPGCRYDKVLIDYLDGNGFIPKYIILTHEHFDHCWGVNELVDYYNIPIICSELCAEAIKNEKKNCSVFYDNNEAFCIHCKTISIESISRILVLLGHDIRFFNTPGHTDASMCFSIERFLFTGDTLIKDTKTVTKLPTGSFLNLKETYELLDNMQGEDYIVYPGHGDSFALDGYELGKMLYLTI